MVSSHITKYVFLICLFFLAGCNKGYYKTMETTAYCGCQKCCDWQWGKDSRMRLDVWNRYVSAGKQKGAKYSGKTANGSYPQEPVTGLFSKDSIDNPWSIPGKIILFPWRFLPAKGTLAANTKYHSFGTKMHIPGYGWGVVEDRGGAIKGHNRIDLYFDSHEDALQWGRKTLKVKIIK